jgi:D-threonate/D-erythronate kinase
MTTLELTKTGLSTPPTAPTRRVLLIADDLTGACDAAAAFFPGRSVRVWLGPAADNDNQDSVQAFNTDSRGLPPEDAAIAVAECALNASHDALLFKKLDSAGRGPIAAELLAAQRALNADITLFAPSFPVHGRIVRDGVLHIHHDSGGYTQLPLLSLFEPEHHPSIAVIDSPVDLVAALASGKRIAICNAETQEELEAFARTATALPGLVLYAGSSGLARALAAVHYSAKTQSQQQPPVAPGTLFIIGTPHPVTQLQLLHLETEQPDADLLLIRPEAEDADVIRKRFARSNPQSLVLSGGDTALRVLRALGARSISLRGEILPGVPWGIIDGGLAHQRTVVTKSGGFGSSSTFSRVLTTLSGQA